LSTQAEEVIASQVSAQNGTRTAGLKHHLVPKEESLAFNGSSAARTVDAPSFREAILAPVDEPAERLAARPRPQQSRYSATKRLLDVLGSVVIGLTFSPLIAIIAIRMSLEDGPIIFRHRRIGQGGKTFECLKFRTMAPNAEQILQELLERDPQAKAEWVRDHKLRNDPRVTRIGRFLRRTSLDELPQLWNVLRGEMSLVGPRPIVREEMLRYGRHLPTYLAAKPGVTGLWQVTGRNDIDYRRRVAMDTYYVRKQGLLMDLKILLKTVKVVIWGRGAY
jgi:Undecaprenyl-phosphate galactose phosphotransferase WbaP